MCAHLPTQGWGLQGISKNRDDWIFSFQTGQQGVIGALETMLLAPMGDMGQGKLYSDTGQGKLYSVLCTPGCISYQVQRRG